MKRLAIFGTVGLGVVLGVWALGLQGQEPAVAASGKVRIGVYESRAIAIAWARSSHNPVGEKMKEYEVAKKANDKKKMAELEAWGPAHQRLLHFQGFGRVPVGDLLQPVHEPMRALLKEKNLAAIAMECDLVAEGVEQVDITRELVMLFQPSEETLKYTDQIRGKQPLSLLELADLPADK